MLLNQMLSSDLEIMLRGRLQMIALELGTIVVIKSLQVSDSGEGLSLELEGSLEGSSFYLHIILPQPSEPTHGGT